jgi:hypothetical protein
MNIGMTCWAKSEVLSERIYGEKRTHAKKVLRTEPFPEKRRVIILGTSYRSTGIVKPIYDHEENDNDYVLVLADEVRHRVIVCQEIDKGQRYRIPFVTFESELEQIPEAGDKSMMRANYEFLAFRAAISEAHAWLSRQIPDDKDEEITDEDELGSYTYTKNERELEKKLRAWLDSLTQPAQPTLI